MKKAIFLICFILVQFAMGQQKEVEELKTLVNQMYQEVFVELRTDGLDDFFHPDFLIINNGEQIGQTELIGLVDQLQQTFNSEENKQRSLKRTNEFDFVAFQIDEQTAWLVYHNRADFKLDGQFISQMHWIENANLVRDENKQWKIKLIHSSTIKD